MDRYYLNTRGIYRIFILVYPKMADTSPNTALTHRHKLLGHGEEVGREADSRANPARLSLRPVPHTLHLSLSGSLMQER